MFQSKPVRSRISGQNGEGKEGAGILQNEEVWDTQLSPLPHKVLGWGRYGSFWRAAISDKLSYKNYIRVELEAKPVVKRHDDVCFVSLVVPRNSGKLSHSPQRLLDGL